MILVVTIILFSIAGEGVFGQSYVGLAVNSETVDMYSSGKKNILFTERDLPMDCSAVIFAYPQTAAQYQSNSPYQLKIEGNPSPVGITVTTRYGRFAPSLSSTLCSQNTCSINVYNNCPTTISNDNYFDILTLTVGSLGDFTYSVNCNIAFNPTKFEWGQLIIIVAATAILGLSTLFARFNSFDGGGLEYNIKWILFVSGSVLFVGLLSLFLPKVAAILMNVVSWLSIFVCVSIVFIEVLYFFFKTHCLRKSFTVKGITIRILDIVGVLLSVPVGIAWWLTGKNLIISDFISICIIISIIKVFKYISFKTALVAYLIIIAIYSTGNIVVSIIFNESFSNYLLFQDNNPYQFQIPILSEAFNQKCVWVSITTIAFPGLLVSYLRRFDKSRNTNIYFMTSLITYFIGSIIWWVVDTFTYYPIPFDAFCEPVMMLSFTMFAFKRKELRTLWEGKFYDEEFLNKNEIDNLGREMAEEKGKVDHFKDGTMLKDLFVTGMEESEAEPSQDIARNPRL